MSTIIATGVMPDHRERSAAVRSRGGSSTIAAENATTVAPSPVKWSPPTDPDHEPVVDLSQPTYSPPLGRNLTEAKTREQIQRDLAREKALADLGKVQMVD